MSINNVSLSAHNRYYPPKLVPKNGEDKKRVQKCDSEECLEDKLDPLEKTIVSTIAPARRAISIPDMLKRGDVIGALGLTGLIAVSLPEDIRDLKDAYKHSKAVIGKKRYNPAYNYRKYQHDFSFFRGTLLHEGMKKVNSEKGKRIVDKIYGYDKTLYNTKFGRWVQKVLGIENGKSTVSKVKTLYGKMLPVQQVIIKKDYLMLKDLTARALKRTSVLGLVFMGLLELPRVVKSFAKGKGADEKVKNGSMQMAKSSLNVLGVTAGMGYIGALGAKKFGSLGSLIGMGLGAIAGGTMAKGIQNLAFKKEA